MKIVLNNEDGERVVIETNTLDYAEGISPDGTRFTKVDPRPVRAYGSLWDCEDGTSWWEGEPSEL